MPTSGSRKIKVAVYTSEMALAVFWKRKSLTCPGFSETEGEPVWEGQFINPYFEQSFYAYSLRLKEGRDGKVDEGRLFELPKDTLRWLSERKYMKLIYTHLNSLQNWERLVKRRINDQRV